MKFYFIFVFYGFLNGKIVEKREREIGKLL